MYIHNSTYDWDREKTPKNHEKHGVPFFEAAGAFDDPTDSMPPTTPTRGESNAGFASPKADAAGC